MKSASIPMVALAAAAVSCQGPEDDASDQGSSVPLTVACVDDPSSIPPGALRCNQSVSALCGDLILDTIYVTAAELGGACSEGHVEVAPKTLAGGAQVVEIRRDDGSTADVVCTSTVTVQAVGTSTPVATRLELWPPNHQWVDVSIEDCVGPRVACSSETYTFTSVSVDEPANDRGDGNTEPDVQLGCGALRVRAERQGGGDGRVYRVEYEAKDEMGRTTKRHCDLAVPPNQAHSAKYSGEDRRITPDNTDCEEPGGRCAPSYDASLNTGRLPDECAKIEGDKIGREGVEVAFGDRMAFVGEWRAKTPGRGENVGFEVTVTSTPAWLSVKAGPDVFGGTLERLTTTWIHPAGTVGPRAKGISNIVLCAVKGCERPPGGAGVPTVDAGSHRDSGVSSTSDAGTGGL